MRRSTWAIWTTLAAVLLAGNLHAQPAEQRRDQIAAATARAVERLRAQVAREQLARNVTVGDVLRATGGTDTLTKTLQRAQMIGGPRWVDDNTCQVRLEIAGPRVAAALLQIVNARPKDSPIAPEVLAARLKDWDNRTFTATSTSTGADTVEQVRPSEESAAWARISDETRQQAIAAAKRHAAGRVMQAIAPVALSNGKTVGEAMADANVRGSVDQWLASRPVTQVEFRDDLQVAVTLATPAAELAETIAEAVRLPESERSRLRQEVENRVAAGSRGSARAGIVEVKRAAAAGPANVPPWVNDQLDADGEGTSDTSRLLAARAAEADAQAKLRQKVDALPMGGKATVGELAKQDARVAEAVSRTISRARASKVQYQEDGSAQVRLSLQLRELWDNIAAGW